MYAVGRYISQGVYTVAGPFHPFGGAVDIIVVEQEDGTFKSTPWNVKFGKFQGVLKRSEKTVDIAVNDVRADFHMYMDNTGEAYFLKDAEGADKEAYLLKDAEGADKENNPLSPPSAPSSGDETSAIEFPKLQEGQEGKESWFPTPDGDYAKQFEMKDSSDDEAEDDAEDKETGKGNSLLLRSEDSVGLPHQFELLVGFPDEDSLHAVTMQRVSIPSTDPSVVSGLDLTGVVLTETDMDTTDLTSGDLKDSKLGGSLGLPSMSLLQPLKTTTSGEVGDVEEVPTALPGPELVTTSAMSGVGLGENEILQLSDGDAVAVQENEGNLDSFEMDVNLGLTSPSLSQATNTVGDDQAAGLNYVALLSTEPELNTKVEVIDKVVSKLEDNEISQAGEDEIIAAEKGIEISLCRHLLRPGMGVEAAAKAFDSQKILLENFKKSSAAITANSKLVVKLCGQYYPWTTAAPIVLGMLAFGQVIIPEANFGGAIKVEVAESKMAAGALVPTGSGGWTLWPFTSRRQKSAQKGSVPQMTKKELLAAAEAAIENPLTQELLRKNGYYKRPRKNKVRTNVPTSEQLASLNLKEGKNAITFTFITRVLGKQQVDARIYLWKWNTRVVISDVDGTITKSDVLGQVMYLVGKDWTQSGVTRLFSAIKENGYELMFLSARSISQAYITRQFLQNVKQDGEFLPDGPVVISPDGLFPSLYREVIRRAPHEFKIACLQEIKSLFPVEANPFYAGFGNRETDAISYLNVGIPKGKIFTINPKGEVIVNNRADLRTYTSLHKLVDDMFPPKTTDLVEDYNSWNFWKVPLPDIEDEISSKSVALVTKKSTK